MGIVFKDWHTGATQPVQVPLAKVTRSVAGLLHRSSKRLFLAAQRVAMIEHTGAIMRAAGSHRGPRRRTDRPTRIETVKAQPGLGHGIQMGCLEHGVIVVTCLAPALVISHN